MKTLGKVWNGNHFGTYEVRKMEIGFRTAKAVEFMHRCSFSIH